MVRLKKSKPMLCAEQDSVKDTESPIERKRAKTIDRHKGGGILSLKSVLLYIQDPPSHPLELLTEKLSLATGIVPGLQPVETISNCF